MKNKNLFKVIGLFVLFVIVLTWIIPGSDVATEGFKITQVNPTGLMSIFSSIDILTSYFIINSILLIFIGIFYSVANKTGAYKELVEKMSSFFDKKPKIFLMLIILFFMLIPSLLGIFFPMIFFVILAISVLVNSKVDKRTAIFTTVGSLLIGFSSNLFSSYFSQVNDYSNYMYLKVALLVVGFVITYIYAIKNLKIEKYSKEVSESFILLEKSKSKRSCLPLIVIYDFILLLLVLGLFSWKTTIFKDATDWILNFEIFNFKIFGSILGPMLPFGEWGNKEILMVVGIFTIITAIVYKLKFSDFMDAVKEGIKKFWVMALVLLLLNVVIVFSLNSTIVATIANFFAKGNNIALITFLNIINVPLLVDPTFFSSYVVDAAGIALGDAGNLKLVSLIGQFVYGATMLIAPTSVLLVAGLIYLEESFVNWFKYIWKYLLMLFLLIFILITIATMI